MGKVAREMVEKSGVDLDKLLELLVANAAAELTTPTGAALVTTWSEFFGLAPACQVMAAGYGAGALDIPGRPNALRAILLDTPAAPYGCIGSTE